VKKNILLIPTTDNVLTNWGGIYQSLSIQGHSVYIISDSNLITRECCEEFIKIDLHVLRLFQAKGLNYFKAMILKLYINIFAKYILKKYQIDVVVVSSDNPIVQNIFVNIAKALGIKTILHQASGILKKPVQLSMYKRLKVRVKMLLFNESSLENIGSDVDICLIQGEIWIEYIDNANYKVIGNEYYRTLKDRIDDISSANVRKFRDGLGGQEKKIVVFFSQPFKELRAFSDKDIRRLYSEIQELSERLSNDGRYMFIFKPHPQEAYYKEFHFSRVLEKVDLDLLIASSDVCITIFSTMAIQSKIALKKTIGYSPNYLPKDVLSQMSPVFDAISDNIDGIFHLIENTSKLKSREFSLISDLSIDTKAIVEEVVVT